MMIVKTGAVTPVFLHLHDCDTILKVYTDIIIRMIVKECTDKYLQGRTMRLYHGSNVSGLDILKPQLADHDRPYVYMTTIDTVAALYLCNAVEKPDYWFPYGFDETGNIPVYHELYPNAFKEVSEGVSGCIYVVDANEGQYIPFKNIPCARLGIVPMKVTDRITVDDAYAFLNSYIEQGKLKVSRFEDKTSEELDNWYRMVAGEMREKNMSETPDCSYARFVRKKIPAAWEIFADSGN